MAATGSQRSRWTLQSLKLWCLEGEDAILFGRASPEGVHDNNHNGIDIIHPFSRVYEGYGQSKVDGFVWILRSYCLPYCREGNNKGHVGCRCEAMPGSNKES